jgi:general secretion pathway protein K
LLAVLWLSAALSAIAFSIATTVRGETERTATAIDGLRAKYLATGALDRALLWMGWGSGHRNPDGSPRFYEPGMPVLRMPFPTGEALVEVIPELSKMNLNSASPEELMRLLLALSVPPDRAQELTAAIVDWRTPLPPGAFGPFDQFYLSLPSSFRARHASFLEIEELLFVKGMTADIYHGSYGRDPEGRLYPQGALKDCVSIYGGSGSYDVNTAQPAVLVAIGIPPEAVANLVEMRRRSAIRTPEQMMAVAQMCGPAASRLRIGGGSIFTLRATASVRLQDGTMSDIRRSAAALIRMNDPKEDMTPFRVLRWYDNVWVDNRGQR